MGKIVTYEGIIEGGLVKLPETAHIPDNTRVYVLVPEEQTSHTPYIGSPRLVDPGRAKDFQKQVSEETPNARL